MHALCSLAEIYGTAECCACSAEKQGISSWILLDHQSEAVAAQRALSAERADLVRGRHINKVIEGDRSERQHSARAGGTEVAAAADKLCIYTCTL